MKEKPRPFTVHIDLRIIWFALCGVIWLVLASSLLDIQFYHQRVPWFASTGLFAFLSRPVMEGIPIGTGWLREHWILVCGGIFFLEQAVFAYLLRLLSKRMAWLTIRRRAIFLFGLAALLGLYAGYQEYQFLWITSDFRMWDAIRPMVQSLAASVLIFTVPMLFTGLRSRSQAKRISIRRFN